MANCEYCGRELKQGEVCGCTVRQESASGYYRLSVKRSTVDRLKHLPKTAAHATKEFFGALSDVASMGSEEVVLHTADGRYESGMQIIDQCAVPTDKEIPVRQYDIAKLSTPLLKKAYGRMQVTNKRVIFRAAGKSLVGPILTEKEFAIEEIGGIDIKADYRFSVFEFVIGLLLSGIITAGFSMLCGWMASAFESLVPVVIVSVVMLVLTYTMLTATVRRWKFKAAFLWCCAGGMITSALAMHGHDFLSTSFFIIGGASALVALVMQALGGIVDDLHIAVRVKGGHDAMEIARKLRKDERSGFQIVRPWRDTELAIRELGALIDDIKHFGDAGIAKWKI